METEESYISLQWNISVGIHKTSIGFNAAVVVLKSIVFINGQAQEVHPANCILNVLIKFIFLNIFCVHIIFIICICSQSRAYKRTCLVQALSNRDLSNMSSFFWHLPQILHAKWPV